MEYEDKDNRPDVLKDTEGEVIEEPAKAEEEVLPEGVEPQEGVPSEPVEAPAETAAEEAPTAEEALSDRGEVFSWESVNIPGHSDGVPDSHSHNRRS